VNLAHVFNTDSVLVVIISTRLLLTLLIVEPPSQICVHIYSWNLYSVPWKPMTNNTYIAQQCPANISKQICIVTIAKSPLQNNRKWTQYTSHQFILLCAGVCVCYKCADKHCTSWDMALNACIQAQTDPLYIPSFRFSNCVDDLFAWAGSGIWPTLSWW